MKQGNFMQDAIRYSLVGIAVFVCGIIGLIVLASSGLLGPLIMLGFLVIAISIFSMLVGFISRSVKTPERLSSGDDLQPWESSSDGSSFSGERDSGTSARPSNNNRV